MSFFKTFLATLLGFFVSLFLLGVVLVAVIVALISSASKQEETQISKPSVLVLDLSSALPEYANSNPVGRTFSKSHSVTMREFIRALDHLKKDDRISGIWLKVDGYGGMWSQAEEIRSKLLEVKRSGKFLYATGNVNGFDEKEYFIASAADSVILNPAANLEMNGIYATLEFFKPLLDKLEIQTEVVRAGSYKSAVEPFILDSASSQNKEMITSLVNGTFDRFLQVVQDARKLTHEQLEQILNDRAILTAYEAHDLKLVDAVMYDDQVRALLHARLNRSDDTTKLPQIDFSDYAGDISEESDNDDGGQIAIVYAVGEIAPGESKYNPSPILGGETIGSDTFNDAMRIARESKSVKSVVLRIDSPGGDAAASEAMWREIQLTREKKPVIVSMAGVAASGGYFIAAAGDTIVAEPTTITGSIGVFYLHFSMNKFFQDKIGINTQTIVTNPHANMFSTATDTERQIIAKEIDTVYQRFLHVVASGRKLSIDSVQQIAQGRVWTGEQGKQIGLVDALGGLDSAITIAARRVGLKKGSYSLRVLPREKSFFEKLSSMFSAQASTLLLHTRSPIDDYHDMIQALQIHSGIQARMLNVHVN